MRLIAYARDDGGTRLGALAGGDTIHDLTGIFGVGDVGGMLAAGMEGVTHRRRTGPRCRRTVVRWGNTTVVHRRGYSLDTLVLLD